MAGVDLATLKELMGHSQISMTMRYVHPTPEHKKQSRSSKSLTSSKGLRFMKTGKGSPQKPPQCPQGIKGRFANIFEMKRMLEPAKGIEPPTYGLRNRCSTD